MCFNVFLCSAARCSLLEAQPTCGESIVKSENLACDRVPLGGAMYLRSAPVVRALPPSHSAQAGSTVGARCVCRPLRWENGICRNGTGIPRNSVPFRSVPVWAAGITLLAKPWRAPYRSPPPTPRLVDTKRWSSANKEQCPRSPGACANLPR